jgi:predicted RND superfamily exporter protein
MTTLTVSNTRLFIGAPYDYWSQYVDIFKVFAEIAGIAVGIGFIISFLFLLLTFFVETHHGVCKIVCGSVVGALLIAITTVLSLVSVAGLTVLAGVNLTGFSNMSVVLSVGFSVEYSVHIVARWLRAGSHLTGIARVEHTMSFLMLPTFMSFLSSLIGVACLAFTEFEFNEVFFFRPLILVMPVTYFFGCWFLPVMVSLFSSKSKPFLIF